MAPIPASAIILTGGRSSRMGADKAALPWGDTTILGRIARELSRGFDDLVIVAGATQELPRLAVQGLRIVRDPEPFEGPMAALHRGLEAARETMAFVCACDVPLLKVELAMELCGLAAGFDAAIPVVQRRRQVLCAAWSRTCQRALGAAAARGERRLQSVVATINARLIPAQALRSIDPGLLSFINVNTPAEYRRALRRSGDSPS